jgi:hypothetical protein
MLHTKIHEYAHLRKVKLPMIRLLLLFILVFPLMIGHAQDDDACTDLLTPRLLPDLRGRVLPGDANRMRESPSLGAETVGFIPGGTEFAVYSGPRCAEGYYWWQVGFESEDDGFLLGWTAEAGDEYWVEPVYVPAGQYEQDYRGVSLQYDSRNVWSLMVETGEIGVMGGDELIEAIDISLDGWGGSTAMNPHIRVFSLAEYADLLPVVDEEITALLDMLETEQFPTGLETPPRVPLVPAAQPFQVLPRFLDFQNGTGVRYITAYSQDFMYVMQQIPLYVYMGVTADGEWLVTVQLPLTIDILPEERPEQLPFNFDDDSYEEYLLEVEAQIEAAPMEAFDPLLPVIDWMIESLLIEPVPVAPTLEITPSDVTYDLHPDVAENLNGEYLDSEPFARFTEESAPPVLRFNFDDSAAFRQVLVYPVALTEQLNLRNFDLLREALENRPEPAPMVMGPRVNAGMPLDTRAEYIDFENGSGIRYIGHITQDFTFVNPLYIFTGLTDDGLHYVEIVYDFWLDDLGNAPVMQPYLNNGLNSDNVGDYYDDAEALIENADPDDFSPSLDALDAFVRSLSVGD